MGGMGETPIPPVFSKDFDEMNRIGLIIILALLCCMGTPASRMGASIVAAPVWTLIWSDDFDGSELDARHWVIADRSRPNYDGGVNYYDPQEVSVDGGSLILRSRPQGAGRDGKQTYSSGRVSTQGKFAFLYGKVEVRAKLPGTQGLWPALWMLSSDRSWPPEIDVAELLGNDPTRIYMTHHWGTRRQDLHHSTEFAGPDFTQDFHVFSIEWSPGKIRWPVDDVERKVETSHVPGKAMYLIFSTSVGGDWPGLPDQTTVFPATMQIDFVKVYQQAKKRR